MSDKYILIDKEPVKTTDFTLWANQFENANARRVGLTKVGKYEISTVFLGIDHSFNGGEPILFETMVFEPPSYSDIDMDRCSTYLEAEKMHAEFVEKYKNMDNQQ
jgi:hypothetical protein